MSEENVEIVRRNTDAFSRGDFDGFMEDWAPDAVVDWSNSRGPEVGVYRGHGEVRRFAQRFIRRSWKRSDWPTASSSIGSRADRWRRR